MSESKEAMETHRSVVTMDSSNIIKVTVKALRQKELFEVAQSSTIQEFKEEVAKHFKTLLDLLLLCSTAWPEEGAGPSSAPPQPRRLCQVPRMDVCGLCQRADCDPDVVGELRQKRELCVHENCVYHASKLRQRGADQHGFYGFLKSPRRRRAMKRAAQQRCCICRLPGASISCCGRRCRRMFHFPCGSERGCVSQFFGEYRSFCWRHRPVQRVRATQQDQTLCLICQDEVAGRPCYTTMVCPSCASAWFHRRCIQGQVLCSGLHYFRCPLCRDMTAFQAEMLPLGMKIPDR
ncbi:PHD finger protein 7-like [Falco naumanni]|uniref:PHD finger protein 7-like n=1 Tax=Falco naumanni TaxID=148594 RepID=UPI001ADE9436|nr:PHD finger protein 7-like [Falco naumanni]